MKFTTDFKKKAVELKKQGIHPNKIFTDEGIDILKSIKKDSESKRIEYLEAKVAYLEAKNSFLSNLPKKKRN